MSTAALAIGLTGAGGAPANAAATHLATCDEAPGATIGRSDRWRIFWDAHFKATPGGPEGRSLYACRRTGTPLQRVRILGYDDDVYGNFEAPQIVADVVQLDNPSRYSSPGRLVDLEHGRVAPGNVFGGGCSDGSGGGSEALLLPGGSVATAPFTGVGQGCPGYAAGALTLDGIHGAAVVAPSAKNLAPSRGLDGRGSGVYYVGADGRAARVEGSGPASTTGWPKAASLKWHRRTYRVRSSRTADVFVAADGVSSFSVRGVGSQTGAAQPLELTVDRRPGTGASSSTDRRSFPVAALAPNSAADVRVIASRHSGVLVAGRFADAPSEVRLRLYPTGGISASRPDLDLPISALPDGPNKAKIAGYGAVVLAASDHIDWWQADRSTGKYAAAAVPATAPGDLSISGRDVVYFTDATGVHTLQQDENGAVSVG